MASTKSVQNAHKVERLRSLHAAFLDIAAVMNRPQRDEAMIREAGVKLDRALFPLLVLIERFGPVGVVDLADRVGRDYTTVSRQLAKLEALGLIAREAGAADKRMRHAVVTAAGKAMTDRIDAARERIGQAIFASWDERELDDFVRLLEKFAEAVREGD